MKTESLLTKLKSQGNNVSRGDIDELLKSVGAPGKKRDEKIAAVQELGLSNTQGHDVATSLEDYASW